MKRHHGIEPVEGLEIAVRRLADRDDATAGDTFEWLLSQSVLVIEGGSLDVAGDVHVTQLGARYLHSFIQCDDRIDLDIWARAFGFRGSGPLDALVARASSAGWSRAETITWLLTRDIIEVSDGQPTLVEGGLERLTETIRDILLESLPLCTVRPDTDGGRIVDFPLTPDGHALYLGGIFTEKGGEREFLTSAQGSVQLTDDQLVFFPSKIGRYGDPLQGIPPDLFTAIWVPSAIMVDPLADRDVWALRHCSGIEEFSLGYGVQEGLIIGREQEHHVTDQSAEVINAFASLETLRIRSARIGSAFFNRMGLSLNELAIGRATADMSAIAAAVSEQTHILRIDFPSRRIGIISPIVSASPNLRSLALTRAELEDRHLVGIERLTNLEALDLSGNRDEVGYGIGDDTVRLIGSLSQLEHLSLSATNITDSGAADLASLDKLRSLSLWNTAVGDATANAIAALTNLEHLDVSSTQVTNRLVSEVSHLPLRSLDLSATNVTGEAATALAGMGRLETVHVPESWTAPGDYASLIDLPNLSKIVALGLYDHPDVVEVVESMLAGVAIDVGY